MDVHREALRLSSSLSHGESELCDGNVGSSVYLSRRSTLHPMDRTSLYPGGCGTDFQITATLSSFPHAKILFFSHRLSHVFVALSPNSALAAGGATDALPNFGSGTANKDLASPICPNQNTEDAQPSFGVARQNVVCPTHTTPLGIQHPHALRVCAFGK